jgi:hypothetical protein
MSAAPQPNYAEFQWHSHARRCEACKGVELDKPRTLARCCLEGAELVKRHLAERSKKRRREAEET